MTTGTSPLLAKLKFGTVMRLCLSIQVLYQTYNSSLLYQTLHSYTSACEPVTSIYRVAQKKCTEHSHCIMQQSSRNESAKKHVCNEQTSLNMSRNSRLKHFRFPVVGSVFGTITSGLR